MALSLTIDVSKQVLEAPAEMERRIAALKGARLNKQIGRAGAALFMDRFVKLNALRANKMGGQRTNFYADAAKATSSTGDENGAVITVAQQGMRQRVYGGVIKPGAGKKYLTIPARAEAYGHRAGDFKNLRFVPTGRDRGMLVEADQARLRDRSARAYWRKHDPKKISDHFEISGGLVMYWLVPQVVQHKDPTILPSADEIEAVVRKTVNAAWAWKSRPAKGGAS